MNICIASAVCTRPVLWGVASLPGPTTADINDHRIVGRGHEWRTFLPRDDDDDVVAGCPCVVRHSPISHVIWPGCHITRATMSCCHRQVIQYDSYTA